MTRTQYHIFLISVIDNARGSQKYFRTSMEGKIISSIGYKKIGIVFGNQFLSTCEDYFIAMDNFVRNTYIFEKPPQCIAGKICKNHTLGIISGEAINLSNSMKPPLICSIKSSPPTKSAPAFFASSNFSPA